MADAEQAPDLARRVDELERLTKMLKAELDEVRDVQIMEKMDLVNLKNELEAIEMENPQITRQKQDTRNIDELSAELKEIHGQLSRGTLNVCKACGSVISRDAKFCGRCGGKS